MRFKLDGMDALVTVENDNYRNHPDIKSYTITLFEDHVEKDSYYVTLLDVHNESQAKNILIREVKRIRANRARRGQQIDDLL